MHAMESYLQPLRRWKKVRAALLKATRNPDSYGVLKIDLKPRLCAGANRKNAQPGRLICLQLHRPSLWWDYSTKPTLGQADQRPGRHKSGYHSDRSRREPTSSLDLVPLQDSHIHLLSHNLALKFCKSNNVCMTLGDRPPRTYAKFIIII